MSKAVVLARVLLALPFLVFGLNHFFEFMKPPQPSVEAGVFLQTLTDARYLWPLVKITEIACGAMILLGQWLPLGLVLLAPITVNIVGYHLYVDDTPQGLGMAVGIAVLHGFLLLANMGRYRELLLRVPEERDE